MPPPMADLRAKTTGYGVELTNRHFNAADSRELMALIEEIRNAQKTPVLAGRGFKVADHCEQVTEARREFLVMSGGSPIPDNFELVKLIKCEPPSCSTTRRYERHNGRRLFH